MARKGNIEIPIAVDTGGVEKSIRNGLIDPIEDASKALDKLEGTDAGKDITRQMDRAQDATSKLDTELDQARKGLDKLGYAGKDAGAKVKSGLDDAKSEAGQSGREAAASFSGGFDDITDFAQETLANAFAGFGPIGAAAGIAFAAVLGAAIQGATDAQDKLNAAREAAVELASQLYENNGKLPIQNEVENLFEILGRESKANGPLQSMIDGFTDFGTVLEDVKGAADLGVGSVEDIMEALQPGDLDKTNAQLKIAKDRLKDYLDERGNLVPVWDEERQDLETVVAELTSVQKATEQAIELNKAVGDASPIDKIAEAWSGAQTSASDYFTETEEGATTFDWSTYLTDAETTLAAANEVKKKIVTLPDDIADEANRVFSDQGAEAANQYIDSYEGASFEDQGRFAAVARANGEGAGSAFAEGTKTKAREGINTWVPPKMVVTVGVDDKAVRDWTPPMKRALVAYTAIAADKKNLGG